MKKIILKTLKIIGILVLVLVAAGTIVYYNSVNYKMYSLHVNPEDFPEVKTKDDIPELAKNLVEQMTFEEKIDQMYGNKKLKFGAVFGVNGVINKRFPHIYVGLNERLHIPPWVLSDGPRGSRVMDQDVNAVTTFPVAMSRGASWDIDLEKRINEVIATEMRANKTNYAATPCINLLRHPGWGRAQETYGEDPWLLGEFGLASVEGIEKHNVMACPKHFALNSIENSRFVVDVSVDERALREVYLPHFKKVIQKGKPASIMSAYNSVNGEFCGNNKTLLTDILRDEWGFEGIVSTDWVYGLYDGVAGVKAGLDVEMPMQDEYSYKTLRKGVDNGEISEKDIDKIVTRTLITRLKYAFIQDSDKYLKSAILKQSSIDLAREAAEKGMVLLKNENVLPFEKSKNKKIAIIGSLADVENTGDGGSSDCAPPYVITPYQGIKKYNEALGNEVILNDGKDLESAKKLAQEADEVVIVVGYTNLDEGEYLQFSRKNMLKSAEAGKLIGKKDDGGDRLDLKLKSKDEQLITAIVGLNKNTVVTYVGSSAIDMSAWQDKAPAILFTWYAGMEGGNALANLLYGDVNPSGKLPFTIAKNQEDYPPFNAYTNKITYGYYHGYTLFEKENKPISYPFGYGLSYTTYAYSNIQIDTTQIAVNGNLKTSIDIKNIGVKGGEEIVQLYIGFKNSGVDRPVKLLRGFKRIAIAPQETKTVTIEINTEDLAWYDPSLKKWKIEAMEYELYMGASSQEKDLLKTTFTIP